MNAFLILDKTIKSMLAWVGSLQPLDDDSLFRHPMPGRDLYHYGDHLDTPIERALHHGPGSPEYEMFFGHNESKPKQGDTDKDNFYHHKEFGTL